MPIPLSHMLCCIDRHIWNEDISGLYRVCTISGCTQVRLRRQDEWVDAKSRRSIPMSEEQKPTPDGILGGKSKIIATGTVIRGGQTNISQATKMTIDESKVTHIKASEKKSDGTQND